MSPAQSDHLWEVAQDRVADYTDAERAASQAALGYDPEMAEPLDEDCWRSEAVQIEYDRLREEGAERWAA